jgi:hypothetical protein
LVWWVCGCIDVVDCEVGEVNYRCLGILIVGCKIVPRGWKANSEQE